MHPLTQSLADMSDNDLADKIFDLERRLNISYRMGNNNLIQQINMVLEDYRAEFQKRSDKQMKDLLEKNGKIFKDVINIE